MGGEFILCQINGQIWACCSAGETQVKLKLDGGESPYLNQKCYVIERIKESLGRYSRLQKSSFHVGYLSENSQCRTGWNLGATGQRTPKVRGSKSPEAKYFLRFATDDFCSTWPVPQPPMCTRASANCPVPWGMHGKVRWVSALQRPRCSWRKKEREEENRDISAG